MYAVFYIRYECLIILHSVLLIIEYRKHIDYMFYIL